MFQNWYRFMYRQLWSDVLLEASFILLLQMSCRLKSDMFRFRYILFVFWSEYYWILIQLEAIYINCSGNIVEKIRNGNDYIKTNKINVKGVLVRICIAAILVILMQYISVTSTVRQIVELSKICNILAVWFCLIRLQRSISAPLLYDQIYEK